MGRTQSWCGVLLCFMWVLNCIDPQSRNHTTTHTATYQHDHTTYLALAQNSSCHRVLEAPISGTHGPPHFLEHNMVESAWSTNTHKPKHQTLCWCNDTPQESRTSALAAWPLLHQGRPPLTRGCTLSQRPGRQRQHTNTTTTCW